MKRKNTRKKNLKIMAAVCSVLLSMYPCEEICVASAGASSQNSTNNNISSMNEADDDWYDDEDNYWNNNSNDNGYGNPFGEYNQADQKDELPHKPFTDEVLEGYTPVRSIEDLQGINNNPGGRYILMNDIDLTQETSPGGSWDTGNGWVPLKDFSGVFDGNGYRLIGMHIYGDAFASSHDIGLFSKIENTGIIRNLGMVDCDINVAAEYSGDYAHFTVGGITGDTDGENCVISNCYVSGTIKAESFRNHDKISIGGIAGVGRIRNCYNMAEIYAPDAWQAGGIVGAGKTERCYNIGKINTSSNVEDAGPIAGYNSNNYAVPNSSYYLDGTFLVNGNSYNSHDVGKKLTDAQMKHASSFLGFDFNEQLSEGIWMIDELSAYPYPQLRSCPQVRVKKLEMIKYPDKLTYAQGDLLDLTGAELAITYEDVVTTSTGINPDMVSGIDLDKAASQTAVVTYLNADCTFDLTVDEVNAFGISLSKKKCTLARNKKIQLETVITPANAADKSVQWSSDNEVVATVTNKGIVRGVNAGIAKITATTSNGLAASCVVTVTVPAKSITLNKTNFTLKKGMQKKLKATLNPLESTDQIEWSSSDPGVVSVNSDGIVKAKRKGYATIMAKTSSGKRAYIKISVK